MNRFILYSRRLGRIALVLLSLWLLVGPTALLQLTAWSWMIVSYSSEDGFRAGFNDTFSGEKPCELCHFVEEIEQPSDKNNTPPPPENREIKLLPVPTDPFLLTGEPPRNVSRLQIDTWNGGVLTMDVPQPPPRIG